MLLAVRDKNIQDLKRTIQERKQLLLEQHRNLKKTTISDLTLKKIAMKNLLNKFIMKK